MVRPGVRVYLQGELHPIETVENYLEVLQKFNDCLKKLVDGKPAFFEVQDFNTRKRIVINVNDIKTIREAGY